MKHFVTLFVVFGSIAIGQTWTAQDPAGAALYSVFFTDVNNGTAVGYNGLIRSTTNGGANWTDQTVGAAILNGVSFVGVNGWAVGNSGTVLKTTNSGTSWTPQTVPNAFVKYAVSFLDANNGLVAGWAEVLRTTNGGTNWTSIDVSAITGNKLFGISFIHSTNGTAVGEGGKILKTTNGGSNWTEQTSGTANTLTSVSFTDANNGTAVGLSGTILKTTNGGTNWSLQTIGSQDLYGVSFTDANNGTAVGLNGTILRTTNGGTNWTTQTTGTSNHFYGVSFTDANTGTTVSGSGTIFRTTNGALPVELTSFLASMHGSAVSLLWQTQSEMNNYGFEVERKSMSNEQSTPPKGAAPSAQINSWTRVGFVEGAGTTNSPREYGFTDRNLTPGKYSYRLKQMDRDGAFKYSQEVSISISAPTVFALYQNYPNPFNPSTHIQFSISNLQFVQLKICDVLGRDVAVLVNEQKGLGTYTIEWNASGVSSGIYFAKLQSNGEQLMKKLLLVK